MRHEHLLIEVLNQTVADLEEGRSEQESVRGLVTVKSSPVGFGGVHDWMECPHTVVACWVALGDLSRSAAGYMVNSKSLVDMVHCYQAEAECWYLAQVEVRLVRDHDVDCEQETPVQTEVFALRVMEEEEFAGSHDCSMVESDVLVNMEDRDLTASANAPDRGLIQTCYKAASCHSVIFPDGGLVHALTRSPLKHCVFPSFANVEEEQFRLGSGIPNAAARGR